MIYILDYGAGNVASLGAFALPIDSLDQELTCWTRTAANSVKSLGFEYKWVETVEDLDKATVS